MASYPARNPYGGATVEWQPENENEWRVSFAGGSDLIEVYSDRGVALLRADELERGAAIHDLSQYLLRRFYKPY